MASKRFYVTTPIYYPTARPHIGSAYTTIAADILARWQRLHGTEVLFLTGTDENAKKVFLEAEKKKINTQKFVDSISNEFKGAWKKLNISYDIFMRTTGEKHVRAVTDILERTYKNGDIYKGTYEGLYCQSCEAYYTEKDLINGFCPIHMKKVKTLKEESYFFRLSKYQKPLLSLYQKNKNFILPESRKTEVINRVKEGLKDISISREDYGWGIKLPFDSSHVAYVWYDALTNYYNATLDGNEKFWPADIHLVGKDILWFHSVLWPAMLMSIGIKLPKSVFAHGWWNVKGEKMGKSMGNVVDPIELSEKYGSDSLRYFLFRETPFGDDGDFSEEAMRERHNNELANKLGNLVSRTSGLCKGEYSKSRKDKELTSKLKLKEISKHMDNCAFDKAISLIFEYIDECNNYVQKKEPWKMEGKDKQEVLYNLVDSIRIVSILLSPFMPETSEKINSQFGFEKADSKNLKFALTKSGKIEKSDILFKKIE